MAAWMAREGTGRFDAPVLILVVADKGEDDFEAVAFRRSALRLIVEAPRDFRQSRILIGLMFI